MKGALELVSVKSRLTLGMELFEASGFVDRLVLQLMNRYE